MIGKHEKIENRITLKLYYVFIKINPSVGGGHLHKTRSVL